MVTLAVIIYAFMFIISGYNFFWPIKMLVDGAIGDKAIAIGWGILLISGLS